MIGVMSVVLLIAMGLGLKNYIAGQFESLGANLILILPGSGFGGGGGGGAGLVGGAEFDERDVQSLRRIPEIEYLVPTYFRSTQVGSEKDKKLGYIMGVNEEGWKLLNLEAEVGELWGREEVQSRAKKAVLGYSLADDLFDLPEDALGKTIRLENQRFTVIGLIKKKGDNETDHGIFIPYTTTFGSINPKKTFWSIYLGVLKDSDVSLVKQEAKDVLLKRYKEDKFSVTEQAEILSTVNQIFSVVNLVLLAIGSISLLVGGIGIMNIMYATVTERTKEVGIRRAIGATKRDIMLQFLTESTVLSALGGISGLLMAGIIVLIARFWFPAAVNATAILVAFGVSSAIGIFFGVFPARRAANLPPIEAIRYE